MTRRIPVHTLDPSGATDGQGPVYDATLGRVIWADPPASSGGGVQSIVPGTGIAVDSTDPANPIVSATGGGGGSAETWDTAVAALTGKVHRWKFDETSGATVADAVGSLSLTLNGTYTRNVTTVTGKGVTLDGSTAYAASTGLGSIPVGSADRTIIALFKSVDINAEQSLFSYGTTATRAFFEALTNVSTNRPNLYGTVAGANAIMNITAATDFTYHLVAFGCYSGQYTPLYYDGTVTQANQAGLLATTAGGNFYVGQRGVDNSRRLNGTVDDIIVCDKWVGKAALDRIYRALPAA